MDPHKSPEKRFCVGRAVSGDLCAAVGSRLWPWGGLAGGGHPKEVSVNSQVPCIYFSHRA